MHPGAIGLVLLSAVGHVYWNFQVKRASDPALGPQHASAEEDEPKERPRSPVLLAPAAALLVLGLGLSLWPGAGDRGCR